MTTPPDPGLDWIQRLQAIAQNGLTFARDRYDIERYEAVRQIAAEMLAGRSGATAGAIVKLFAGESGYATPKVDVRSVIFREDKILLVRERSDGLWTLPGGWADVCASPAENVEREIVEETGYTARAEKILAIYDRSKHPHDPPFAFHVYKIFLRCEIIGGAPKATAETDAVEFFAEENIPALSTTRIIASQIKRMFEHHRDPNLPTDFDLA